MTDLAVIIVNWNTRDLLRACLASLYRYTEGLSYEVLVVDNASSDGSPEMVAQEFPAVQLLRNVENVGFAKANNQVLRLTTSRYLLLLNSDTELAGNVLKEMVRFLDAHPSVGICGPKLLNPDGTRQYSCDVFPRRPLRLLYEKWLDFSCPGNRLTRQGTVAQWDYNRNFPVDYLIGAVFAIRRATLDQIGLLDEQFFMYAEDLDWCYRAALAGWKTYYLGELSVYHYNRGSSARSPELSARLRTLRATSLAQFYRKHYGALAGVIMKLLMRLKNRTQGL